MVEGINDSPQDAKRLLRILRGIPSKINLIPLNEAPEIPFKRPSEERVKQFQEILMEGVSPQSSETAKGEGFWLPVVNSGGEAWSNERLETISGRGSEMSFND